MIQSKLSSKDIVRDLKDEILTKKLARGMRLPTGIELSHRYGVSSRTIDRAMNHLIQLGLVERIPGKGSFVLSNFLSFRKQKVCFLTFTYGTFLEDSPKAAFAADGYLNKQLENSLIHAGYDLEHIEENVMDDNQHAIQDRRNILLKKRLENYDLIVLPAGEQLHADAMLRSCKAPKILFLDDVVHPGPWNQIVYDYRPGFQKALKLFKRINCDKIISLGFSDDETSNHRLDIFRNEALNFGFNKDCLLEQYVKRNPLSRYMSGQDFAENYIRQQLFDHAIFCSSDFLMIGMMLVFRNRGLVPGRDFQLISYDNFEGRMKNFKEFQFGVTSITHPQDAMVEAFQEMLQNIGRQHKKNQFYQTYFVPAQELVIRQSTRFSRH